jgi:hypothetical protein
MLVSYSYHLFASPQLARRGGASPHKGGHGESVTPRATGLVNCYGYQILTALGDVVAR